MKTGAVPAVSIERLPWTRCRVDVCAFFTTSDTAALTRLRASLAADAPDLRRTLRAAPFTGAAPEVLTLHSLHVRPRTMLLAGLGRGASLQAETLRRAAASAVRTAGELRAASLALVLPDSSVLDLLRKELAATGRPEATPAVRAATALVEGALLGEYRYDRWKTGPQGLSPRLKKIILLAPPSRDADPAEHAVRRTAITCEGTRLARDLSNAPGNELPPAALARTAAALGRRHRFRVQSFAGAALRRERMGGLIGVGMGSANPPRFIIMEHGRRRRGTPTVVLIGKGVTFDSGGISIKPSADMAAMKMDKSGAAAVIAAVTTAARLRIPVHLIGLVPAAENLPGGRALRPGDILTHANGMTSEVDNTDAEGRLILADALAYARRFRPSSVIDLATLTGAVVVALGHVTTGMMGTHAPTMESLRAAGLRTYERVWQLPLFEEYEKLIASEVADVRNVGGKWAGAITGALFLRKFAGDLPWVHLDIAGTAMMEERFEYIPRGASGVGVRLLTDYLLHLAGGEGKR